MKKAIALVLCLAMATGFTGCTQKDDGELLIGANIFNFANGFVMSEIKPNLEDISTDIGATIEIVDSEGKADLLLNQVDTFVNKGVDAMVLNLVDPAAADEVILKAKEADLPLVLFNREPVGSKEFLDYDKVWYVGTESKESGDVLGQMITDDWTAEPELDLNGDGVLQYVMIMGEKGHPDAEARAVYSIEMLNNNGIETEELGYQVCDWKTELALEAMNVWLSNDDINSKIEVVISVNDKMAFGVVQSLSGTEFEGIPVYGVDALDEALSNIESGKMYGSVLNDGPMQAQASMDIANNVYNGKDPLDGTTWEFDETGKCVRVPYVAVTRDNFQDFK